MSETLTCGSHGKQDVTFVCNHIPASMKSGKEIGFNWSIEDGDFTAICDACNTMGEAEWDEKASGLIQVLCKGCFLDAARMNDISLEGVA